VHLRHYAASDALDPVATKVAPRATKALSETENGVVRRVELEAQLSNPGAAFK
jgi:hypothetical protein